MNLRNLRLFQLLVNLNSPHKVARKIVIVVMLTAVDFAHKIKPPLLVLMDLCTMGLWFIDIFEGIRSQSRFRKLLYMFLAMSRRGIISNTQLA